MYEYLHCIYYLYIKNNTSIYLIKVYLLVHRLFQPLFFQTNRTRLLFIKRKKQGFWIGVDQQQEGTHCEGGATCHQVGQVTSVS